jgi:hypothetical protein
MLPSAARSERAAQPRGAGGPGVGKRARLRGKLSRRGHRLVVGVRLLEGRGALRVRVGQGSRRAAVSARRRRNLLRATAFLPRDGRWKVIVRFEGRAGWADRCLAPRSVRVR